MNRAQLRIPSLRHCTFVRFRFILRTDAVTRLPEFSGSALRGGFGMALKKTACTQPRCRDCLRCLVRRQCVYSLIFETPVPEESELMSRYSAAPHPFVLEPPEDGEIPAGQELAFGLVLIGQAVDLLPWFILAFEELGRTGVGQKINGRRGRFRLVSVSRLLGEEESLLYRGDTRTLTAPAASRSEPEAPPLPSGDRLRITLHTPMRIKYKGRFTNRLDYHILFRNLLRRISLLSFFHCGHRLDDSGFAELIRRAEDVVTVSQELRWQEQTRWSGRQRIRTQFGGLLGTVRYQGDFAPFLPFLQLGAQIHCGKGCTFGLGRFSID